MTDWTTIDEYIGSFPVDVQPLLDSVRQAIHDTIPDLGETIRYRIPTLTVDGRNFVHFAGWKHHISLYPVPAGDVEFERVVDAYRSGRSTVKFPLSRPIPLDVIRRIVTQLAGRQW
ncbi:iron chaperone [Rhodococcus sp. 27YEA15]|uniref:iron chaperone n=1 Tax=Rhodococcus sp. 27YEA15 TaxID=3156259 RepID=UPI003C7B49E1